MDWSFVPGSTLSDAGVTRDWVERVGAADLVVVEVTRAFPMPLYILGCAHARHRAVLVMYHDENVPIDVESQTAFRYRLKAEMDEDFGAALRTWLTGGLANPDRFKLAKTPDRAASVFISYSHKDLQYLERLQVHLRPLKRKQRIEPWDDTQIQAGQNWKTEIDAALKRAKAAVLLVSADYLASDFIDRDEVSHLLHSAQERGTVILPVIVKPCGFGRHPELGQFQAVNAKLSLAEMAEVDRERVYDEVVQRIGAALGIDAAAPGT